ncbi:MAG: potassium transporter TrkG [Pseudomonadota bacterium]
MVDAPGPVRLRGAKRPLPLATRIPPLVLLAGIMAASMYIPAIHALVRDNHPESRAFFYWGTIFLVLIGGISIASSRDRSSNVTRSHLLALLGVFTVLPAMAAVPFREAVGDTRFINAYVESVAAITTTGGTVFAPDRLSDTVHVWRALLAWQGGLFVWVAAVAILAPLRLGGFEVTYSACDGQNARLSTQMQRADPALRLLRYTLRLAPIYGGLTLLLWLLLWLAGEGPTDALIHAMSTLSTSGITSGGGVAGSEAGFVGEVLVAAFLIFAISRQTFAQDVNPGRITRLGRDREIRMAGIIVAAVTVMLFARHWFGALDVDGIGNFEMAMRALWGTAFTVLSFLTTAGFESGDWATAKGWSGLETPIVLLVGLALFGGGVATTAGGVKLLRIYALYEHGRREMDLLVHPSAALGRQGSVNRISMRGVEAAWVFFMLFAITIAGVTLALTLSGETFDISVVMAVSALSTTGPLAEMVLGTGPASGLGGLSDVTKLIWASAMVLGRLETLALIALFNPDFWRN